ncbi:hypothetical protein AB4G91_06880 [Macrococcoides goetzii]|uniref:hypothetical protein n=1 Tax=Macrococcus sp. PK TaxID=2801919 RepID=UPI001F0FC86A|nr:hypothetical protein [Macrococcus sp. PK]MCH4984909.1 hypothetical protein [Macrococcus sp. PK]
MKLILKLVAYLLVTMFIIFNMTDDIIKMQFAFYFVLIGVVIIGSVELIKYENLKGEK